MTKTEFELLRICRSAELAYFMSDHNMEKPKFIQSWFKNKVKVDRQELTNDQIQTICSEWQLKQKTFYKKYRGFVDHFNKVIQNLQFLNEANDTDRLNDLKKQLEVLNVDVLNALTANDEIDRDNLPEVNANGLLLVLPSENNKPDDKGNLLNGLDIEIRTLDAKKFYVIVDIIRIHGFDIVTRDKYVAGELVSITLSSSAENEFNAKVIGYEHGRDKDWREELTAAPQSKPF